MLLRMTKLPIAPGASAVRYISCPLFIYKRESLILSLLNAKSITLELLKNVDRDVTQNQNTVYGGGLSKGHNINI